MTEISYGRQPPVDGYGPGWFRVAGEAIAGAVAVGPAGARPWGGYDDTGFEGVDLVILGTGAEIARAPETFTAALAARGIAVEAMASPAACRTYNMLLAEARRVALAALPV